MTFWVAGAVLGSAVIGGISSNSAADTQAESAQQGMDAQRSMFDKQNELQEPFRQAGLTAKDRELLLLGLGGSGQDFGKYAKDFSLADFQADPGYAFRMSEGLKALDRTAAARGGLISGAALKGAQRYGQQAASDEYQNAFNRYQVNRSNQLQPLQSLMGAGQTATNTLSNAAGQLGQGMAEGYAGIGNARASGYVGGANAISNGIGSWLNYNQNQNLLGSLNSGGGSYGSPYMFGSAPSTNSMLTDGGLFGPPAASYGSQLGFPGSLGGGG